MYEYETPFWRENKVVCGIDEAGRGPLAGPVCAAAVMLDPDHTIEGLNDSKKLSEKKREFLYEEIIKHSLAYGIAMATPEEIDEINILQATFLAMNRAFDKLAVRPDAVLVDGNRDPHLPCETTCITKGDSLSGSIAAASILAKVTRDRLMVEIAAEYPEYRFEVHKGYPTKMHRELILQYGPSAIHRRSFLKKLLGEQK